MIAKLHFTHYEDVTLHNKVIKLLYTIRSFNFFKNTSDVTSWPKEKSWFIAYKKTIQAF